ncbi:uncharacterized protein LOC111782536 [Cucurbita pepo subsp. pepo]|uniref:uncharacterized protein LOC111782536 n=1 Tax=Cucurbita pepo subsp. pepo TaxID=3664 RepID=UPI000C9DA72E|nr:uncharacterized protein LOC111782536 [Cucurbita pepo subsp. pepo]
MGAHLCSFRRFGVSRPFTPASPGDGYAMCRRRRPQRRWREEREGRREMETSIEKKEMKKEYMSLEELLLASPGAPSERAFGNGGHGGFKRKVHPTRMSQCSSFCERSGVVSESVAEDHENICRPQTGKLRKKVSFRLPEVSDVILIYSPEGDAAADGGIVAS